MPIDREHKAILFWPLLASTAATYPLQDWGIKPDLKIPIDKMLLLAICYAGNKRTICREYGVKLFWFLLGSTGAYTTQQTEMKEK